MACPKGEFPNPVKTDTYPNECAKRKRCPTGYHKTKKGCVENSTARNNRSKKNKKSKSGLSDDDIELLEAYYPNGLSDDDKNLLNEYAPDSTPKRPSPMPEFKVYSKNEIDDLKPKPVPKLSPQIRLATRRTLKSKSATPEHKSPQRSKRKSTPKRGFFARLFGNTPTPSPRYYKE